MPVSPDLAKDGLEKGKEVRQMENKVRDQAYYSSTTPAQQLQDACDKAAEEVKRMTAPFKEVKHKEVKHYEEWLAGQHGGHDTRNKKNWAYCDTCRLKFRTGFSPGR